MIKNVTSFTQFVSAYPLLYDYMFKTRYERNLKNNTSEFATKLAHYEVREIIQDLIVQPKSFNSAESALERYQGLPERRVLSKLFNWSWPHSHTQPELKSKWQDVWYPDQNSYTILLEPVVASLGKDYVSINNYGSKILNCKKMMIVDVDITNEDGCSPDSYIPSTERMAINTLNSVASEQELCFRVYRTRNGLRYIETSRLWEPQATTTQRLLTQLYCDPRYAALCKSQNTFRARLTPKYWRLNGCEDDEVGTCEYLTTYGHSSSTTQLEELTPLIEYHDQHTKALLPDLYLA